MSDSPILTALMIAELKSLTFSLRGDDAKIFNDCWDATRSGAGKIARERKAARERLVTWLKSEPGIWYARQIGFASVATLQVRIAELESELASLKTCDVCESPANRHVCSTHCHR